MRIGRHPWRDFESPKALAAALAHDVALRLDHAVAARGRALMAVSGGTTPVRFLEALSRERLNWDRVIVTLVDERFVPPSSPRSNERLVREALLKNEAAQARFNGLYRDAPDVEAAAGLASTDVVRLPLPFDVVVLGMGMDGHTASFFADAPNLDELLDPDSEAIVLPVHPASTGEARLTLSLARLVEARFVVLHIEGSQKRDVLQSILGGGASAPVGAIFVAAPSPVNVFWTE